MNACDLIGCRMSRDGVCKKSEHLSCQYPARKDVADLLINQLEDIRKALDTCSGTSMVLHDTSVLAEVSETLDIFHNMEI